MPLLDSDIIPAEVGWVDEYLETPGVYTYPDEGAAVIGVTGLDNVVEIALTPTSLSRLIDELTGMEELLTREDN